MKIGILLTGRSPDEIERDHGSYGSLFETLLANRGFEFTTYEVLDNQFPASINDADGWLLTGSKFGVYESLDWIAPLEDFVRASYAADVPMIGVCFGHQIIAQALGGEVKKFSKGWSVGAIDYQFVDSAQRHNNLSSTQASGIKLIAWHQDQVTKLPADARVIARSDFCPYAILAYKNRVLTIQAHPEFNSEYTRDLLAARGDTLPEAVAVAAKNNLEGELSITFIADQFEAFFKHRLINMNVPVLYNR